MLYLGLVISNNEFNMTQFQSIFKRFLKGIIAGAVASMAMVTVNTPTVWGDFALMLNSLAIAGASGAVTGLLLAVEKWASWSDTTTL